MGFYLGPPHKQRNPRAINCHVPKLKHVKFNHLKIHNHLHGGLKHVGDVTMTKDFVIRNQFDTSGNLIGGIPRVNHRFGKRKW